MDDDAVHVVRVAVPDCRARIPELFLTLSGDERERAGRFTRKADHDRYVVARGTLRALLATAVRADSAADTPSGISLARGPWGKPHVAGGSPVRFNVSHAGDVVLIALARGREVGVDVEHARPDVPVGELAPVALCKDELAWWKRAPPDDRHRAFFALWTRKEAITKAIGTGLGRTDVPWTAQPGGGSEEVVVSGRLWTVCGFEAATGYPAAVAAEGPSWPLRTWTCGLDYGVVGRQRLTSRADLGG